MQSKSNVLSKIGALLLCFALLVTLVVTTNRLSDWSEALLGDADSSGPRFIKYSFDDSEKFIAGTVGYANVRAVDGYLIYDVSEDYEYNAEVDNSCTISIPLLSDGSAVNLSAYDYITFDMDVFYELGADTSFGTNYEYTNYQDVDIKTLISLTGGRFFFDTAGDSKLDSNTELASVFALNTNQEGDVSAYDESFYTVYSKTNIVYGQQHWYPGPERGENGPKSVHLTFVYGISQNTVFIYEDGVFLDAVGLPGADKLYSFCLNMNYSFWWTNASDSNGFAAFDNFEARGFKKGYVGSLNECVLDQTKTLQTCKDSVLYNKQ